ncbi:DUF4142 domain-containing protein [Sphingomonas sp. JC676]|uniref:DUF4142 domain-containing protein n=1 Tax=Sphingomonas sp. JC676 TaxID=2768065 RepID=UPI0016583B45|nr:DUF4142 domain-containing protein [Sphingomonas sp. JC676]MBC9033895.1 DUF4142 domain-containing protein [Sphingomonas sp. JC676]
MRSMVWSAAFAAMGLAAGTAGGQQAAPAPSNRVTPDALGFVAVAGASDLYEIQSSQLAQQKAGADSVRQFAAMMIEHHMMTTKEVTKAARAAGLTPPPPVLEPRQQAMIDELRGLDGEAFDAAYVRQQRMAHDEALALHTGYAKDGDKAPLRAAAAKAVPIVRRHIERLRSLSSG